MTIGWIAILAAILLLASSTNVNSNEETHKIQDLNNEETDDNEKTEVELNEVNLLQNDKNDTIKDLNNISFNGIDFESILHKVEWSTLLFFGCLFIFMKSLEELGLLDFLGNLISDLIKTVENKSDRLVFALVMLIVLSAIISR